ncbi:hypothetical protein CEXT_294261 [Caerostris extrusa]|uniref:Uncharacterized protein n=1 Tax=Caerostris extrusa TaxID=172846 RepID=A0AAV4NLI7_CAEEX|nr:hypothetical protein CEXT_294261 [Caerostris extrusa]
MDKIILYLEDNENPFGDGTGGHFVFDVRQTIQRFTTQLDTMHKKLRIIDPRLVNRQSSTASRRHEIACFQNYSEKIYIVRFVLSSMVC